MSITTIGAVSFITGPKSSAIVMMNGAGGTVYSPTAKGNFSDPPKQDVDQGTAYAKWGTTNDQPNKEYARFLENTGVLSSATDIISRIAIGRGPMPVIVEQQTPDGEEQLKMIDDPDIHQWLMDNNITAFSQETILDVVQTGHAFCQMLSNRARNQINRIRRTDASLCRFEKRNPAGAINNIYISHEWGGKAVSAESEYVKKVQLLDIANPLMDLVDEDGKLKELPAEFAIASHYRLFNRQYYAIPLWYTVRKWCEISMAVPEMKAHMFNNQMTIKYVIQIDEQYWISRWKGWNGFTDDDRIQKRETVLKEMDKWLAGNENAYKSFITPTRTNMATGEAIPLVKVEVLEDKIKEGKLLPDNAAADSQILFALALNPALLGVDMPGGMYGGGKGGSNIREAFLVQILIREVERAFVAKPLNVVARVNGWTEKWPGLQWRFPNHYLTTLDSGKNAKPIL